MERELVFDIDLTDYDDVRTCGKEGHICSKCWPLMAAAVKVGGAGWLSAAGGRWMGLFSPGSAAHARTHAAGAGCQVAMPAPGMAGCESLAAVQPWLPACVWLCPA